MMLDQPTQDLQLEISQLEARLHDLRSQLDVTSLPTPPASHPDTKTQWNVPSGMMAILPFHHSIPEQDTYEHQYRLV